MLEVYTSPRIEKDVSCWTNDLVFLWALVDLVVIELVPFAPV